MPREVISSGLNIEGWHHSLQTCKYCLVWQTSVKIQWLWRCMTTHMGKINLCLAHSENYSPSGTIPSELWEGEGSHPLLLHVGVLHEDPWCPVQPPLAAWSTLLCPLTPGTVLASPVRDTHVSQGHHSHAPTWAHGSMLHSHPQISAPSTSHHVRHCLNDSQKTFLLLCIIYFFLLHPKSASPILHGEDASDTLEIIHCQHLNSIRFLLVFLQQLLQNALQALINFSDRSSASFGMSGGSLQTLVHRNLLNFL